MKFLYQDSPSLFGHIRENPDTYYKKWYLVQVDVYKYVIIDVFQQYQWIPYVWSFEYTTIISDKND